MIRASTNFLIWSTQSNTFFIFIFPWDICQVLNFSFGCFSYVFDIFWFYFKFFLHLIDQLFKEEKKNFDSYDDDYIYFVCYALFTIIIYIFSLVEYDTRALFDIIMLSRALWTTSWIVKRYIDVPDYFTLRKMVM